MKHRHATLLALVFLGAILTMNTDETNAQPSGFNYDESKVPDYELPDPLIAENGARIENAEDWKTKRRPEVLRLFETHVYGRSAPRPDGMKFMVRGMDSRALGGKATRKEVDVYFSGDRTGPSMRILMFVPNDAGKPVPAFLGLNFFGNHTVHGDPGIQLSDRWMRSSNDKGIVNNRATEESRGTSAGRWDVETIIDRGFALATVYCGDLEPDHTDGWKDGVRSTIHPRRAKVENAASDGGDSQGHPPESGADEWGAIGAWAWGLSRAMDYFETDPAIDEKRVAVMGHSRLGKTSLWAGAQDERFAMVISNNSGCGGAALSRRRFGETVQRINQSFPHWFCRNHRQYNENESALPVDHHMLIALMAPRPVYIASAQDDQWADPKGEFLSGKHAEPVYALFGLKGLGVDVWPAVDRPVGDTIGYHVRSGRHDVTDYDWEQYIRFAEKHFK